MTSFKFLNFFFVYKNNHTLRETELFAKDRTSFALKFTDKVVQQFDTNRNYF